MDSRILLVVICCNQKKPRGLLTRRLLNVLAAVVAWMSGSAGYFLLSIFSFKCLAQASAVLRFPRAESDLFTE